MIKKIAIVNDAGYPQFCGPVRNTESIIKILREQGYEVLLIEPNMFRTIRCPKYPDIQIPLDLWKVSKFLDEFKPDAIHIVSEGTLGLATRRYCLKHNYKFSSAYHTKFPEFIYKFIRLPTKYTYPIYKWFHNKSEVVFTPSKSIKKMIERRGFKNVVVCPGGVDTQEFSPEGTKIFQELPRPIWLNVGRVSPEKNLEAFLDLNLPGTKIIVGDGPHKHFLEKKYEGQQQNIIFTGKKFGEELAECYRSADVFVFPSIEDTFGLVIIEALASGLPVAAYPVNGPIDILEDHVGTMRIDLKYAAINCLQLDKKDCVEFAKQYDWKYAAKIFLDNIVRIN